MLSGEILINEQQAQLKIWKVLDLVYLQKLHHIVEQEPVVKIHNNLQDVRVSAEKVMPLT